MNKLFAVLFSGLLATILMSCNNDKMEISVEDQTITLDVQVEKNDVWTPSTRDGETVYEPYFHFYLFGPDGKFIVRKGNKMTNTRLEFPGGKEKGTYTLYCITGWNLGEQTEPTADALANSITHQIPSAKEMCLGMTTFTVTGSQLKYDVMVKVDHIMAKLDLLIEGVPADAEGITATLPSQANTFTFAGVMSGNTQSQKLTFEKSATANADGTYNWSVPETIVFPCADGTTSMPINIEAKISATTYSFETTTTTCCMQGTTTSLTTTWPEVESLISPSFEQNPWAENKKQTGTFEMGDPTVTI